MVNWSSHQAGVKSKSINRFRNFKKWRWGTFSITSISIALFVVLVGSYIVIINVVSTKGAQIHTLDITKKNLIAENERLAVEAARLQSLAVIEKGATEQIEIGDDGLPTGKTKPAPEEGIPSDTDNSVTYTPKMVPMSAMSFVKDNGPLAQK